MGADRWCCLFRRNPHVPSDGGLIVTDAGRAVRLCRACWRLWNSENWGDQ